jgi:hypothetical protein
MTALNPMFQEIPLSREVFTWPSDRNLWLYILGHRMLQILHFRPNDGSIVQSPESAIEAVFLNPNDLRASRGQAMVQFAAKRWFKSQPAWASGAQRRAARNEAKRSGGSLGKPEWQREGAYRPIRPTSEAVPELAGRMKTKR